MEVGNLLHRTNDVLTPCTDAESESPIPAVLRPSFGIVLACVVGIGIWLAIGSAIWHFW